MSSQLETELASLHSLEEELMDHQTFAQLLGNYGEFVGAIAVVATLAYLSLRIRQHTKQVASTYTRAMWERTDNRMMLTASNADFAA